MIRFVFSAVLLALVTLSGVAGASRPNLVFLLLDDVRNDTMGYAGHPVLQTPAIDRLAEEGVRFENAFVTTSICAASRATLLTGLYQRTHGFNFGLPAVSKERMLASYPAVLRKAGYRTGFIGKYGIKTEGKPESEIFDFYKPLNRTPYFNVMPDGTTRHETDRAADEALEFLADQPADKPFCLSVSFNAPHAEDKDKDAHYPWPPSADGKYADEAMPPPRLDSSQVIAQHPGFMMDSLNRERYFWRWDTPEKYDFNMRAYLRLLTGVDTAIGRIREGIVANDLAENTVIIVMADNGYYMGDRGFAGKWSHYEQSLRVPLVIYDPRLADACRGSRSVSMALNVDIPPTLLDLAGVDAPDGYQGRSLVPLLCEEANEAPADWRTEFFAEHFAPNKGLPKWEGVRTERYVYARYHNVEPAYEYLHDLKIDPDQLENLIDDPKYADTLKSLRQPTDAYLERYAP